MPLPALPALFIPPLLAAGAVVILLLPWLIRLPALAVAGLLASLLAGQLIRLPLPGQGGGVLVSDIAVIIVLAAALIKLRFYKQQKPLAARSSLLMTLVVPFLLWSLFTLAVNAPSLGASHTAIAAAYWLRLASHLLLLPALGVLFADTATATVARHGLIVVTIVLSIGGLIQRFLLPDLLVQATGNGWDPHAGRLVSSWLDPNFLGGFYALILPYLVSRLRLRATAALQQQNIWLLFTIGFSGASLILTQSRSALLALAAAVIILSPLLVSRFVLSAVLTRRAASISAALLIIGCLGLGGFILRERLFGILQLDETVALRARALRAVWPLAEQHAWLGVGYNAFQFAALRAGIISGYTIHSRAGADNSLLTLWVTTGLSGLVLFLLPLAASAQLLLRDTVRVRSSGAAGALVALTALCIHSQFVNSLLYAHLLITLALIMALALLTPPAH